MTAVRVLLVDDQQLVRIGFRMILRDEPDIEVVGEATDGRQALEQAARLRPDVVVMDIRMPVMDGVEATRRLVGRSGDGDAGAASGPPPRVLILTTFDADEYVVEALRAGASGFLLKDVPPADFAQAIRVVAAGDALLAPSVTRQLLDRFRDRLPAPAGERHERLRELTERELEVLKLVARGAFEPRDRRPPRPRRADREDACLARPSEARPAGPCPGRRPRVRGRPRPTRERPRLTPWRPARHPELHCGSR